MDGGAKNKAVILVVGADTALSITRRVAAALAKGSEPSGRDDAPNVENTASGTLIYTRPGSSSDWVVVSTTPVLLRTGWSLVDNARAWVSQNWLRNLSCSSPDRKLYVVCVMDYSNPDDVIVQSESRNTWLHLLAYIFQGSFHWQESRQESLILMLVKVQEDTQKTKEKIKVNLQRVGFARGERCFKTFTEHGEEDRSLQNKVHEALDHSCYPDHVIPLDKVAKRCMKIDGLSDFYGPWGPEKAIVFGPRDSKTSAFAQMLTSGSIPTGGQGFLGKKGEGECQGRGWYVFETVDLEEIFISPSNEKEFVKRVGSLTQGIYSHFICVTRKDIVQNVPPRLITSLQVILDHMSSHFTVVISDAGESWRAGVTEADMNCLKGCTNNYSVELRDDPNGAREISMKQLEEQLTILLRPHTSCPPDVVRAMLQHWRKAEVTDGSAKSALLLAVRSKLMRPSSSSTVKPTLKKVDTHLNKKADEFLRDLYKESLRAERSGSTLHGSSSSSTRDYVWGPRDQY